MEKGVEDGRDQGEDGQPRIKIVELEAEVR